MFSISSGNEAATVTTVTNTILATANTVTATESNVNFTTTVEAARTTNKTGNYSTSTMWTDIQSVSTLLDKHFYTAAIDSELLAIGKQQISIASTHSPCSFHISLLLVVVCGFIILFFFTSCIIIMAIVIEKMRRKKRPANDVMAAHHSDPDEAYYEDVKDVGQTPPNASLPFPAAENTRLVRIIPCNTTHKGIKMNDNECYVLTSQEEPIYAQIEEEVNLMPNSAYQVCLNSQQTRDSGNLVTTSATQDFPSQFPTDTLCTEQADYKVSNTNADVQGTKGASPSLSRSERTSTAINITE